MLPMDAVSRLASGVTANFVQISLVFLIAFLSGSLIFNYVRRGPKNLPPGLVGIPVFGYLPFLGAEPHKKMVQLAKKYGDVFSLYMGSTYTIIVNEYSAVRDTISHSAALNRSKDIFGYIPRVGFIAANGDEWQEQRRFSIFSARDLGLGRGVWEQIILEEVQCFVSELQSHKGQPTEISHRMTASIASNIISLLIGRRLNKETESETIQLMADFSDVSFSFTGPSDPATVMPRLRKYLEAFKIAGYDKAAQIVHDACNFIKDEIHRHKKSPEFKDVRDFINVYLEKLAKLTSTKRSDHYFSEINLEGNLKILFLAASDTILSSLGWTMRLMAKHQDMQQKVYEELMEALGKDGVARYEERNKIPYTFAVMLEVQRFASIVPLSTTRIASQDFEVQGYTIPKGAAIVSNLWALHFDPNYWDEPEVFRPERFLSKDGTKILKNQPSFAPFSIGRRNCPGETIAWMEILTYFTEIIKKFHVSTPKGVEPEFKIINGLVARLAVQELCFTERTAE